MAATPDRTRLIINADDFGFSEGVTRGIVEAHAAGSVTSASIMANGIDWDNAVRLARATRTLGFGVHLNLVQGRPLLRVPSLTDPATNEFYSLGVLALRAVAGRIDRGELEAETRAQIERVRGAGIAVTHLDSHRHAHALPAIFPVVARVVRDAGIRVIRIPREPLRLNSLDAAATARKVVLELALRAAGALPLAAPLVTTDHFRGISLQGGTHFASAPPPRARHARAGEHGAHGASGARRPGPGGAGFLHVAARDRARGAACQPACGSGCAAATFELVSFAAL